MSRVKRNWRFILGCLLLYGIFVGHNAQPPAVHNTTTTTTVERVIPMPAPTPSARHKAAPELVRVQSIAPEVCTRNGTIKSVQRVTIMSVPMFAVQCSDGIVQLLKSKH